LWLKIEDFLTNYGSWGEKGKEVIFTTKIVYTSHSKKDRLLKQLTLGRLLINLRRSNQSLIYLLILGVGVTVTSLKAKLIFWVFIDFYVKLTFYNLLKSKANFCCHVFLHSYTLHSPFV